MTATRLFAALLLLGALPAALAKETFLPAPPPPDRDFYVQAVAPWIEEQCAPCHRAEGAGAFLLAPPDDDGDAQRRRRKDFERVLPFVNRRSPWESRLLLKPLDPLEGGDPHVGGVLLAPDTEAYDRLLDFLCGATPTNLPPEVYFEKPEIRARPGETVVIDGRGSYDRDREDMEHLAYHWTLVARPAESRVRLADRRASRLEIKPDTGGSYVVELRVGDGKVWSAPRQVTVEVFDHVQVARTKPGGISGLERTDAQNLKRLRRLYLDVLGRSPTPAEALAEERKGIDALVRNILLRAEGGRAWVEEVTIRFGLYGDYRPVGDEAALLALRIPAESLAPPIVEGVLARDPSFMRRHPPGRSLATAVAELLLGRSPTAQEIAAAVELAAGRSAEVPGLGRLADPRAWLLAVLDSEAFRRAAVLRRLDRFLASGDARSRLERAMGAVARGPKAWRAFCEDMLRDDRYLGRRQLRPKDPVTFLRTLFVDLLERKPTDRELAALVQAVETMPGQSAAFAAVVRVLVDSGEAPIPLLVEIEDGPRWVTDRFLRYLGRPPSAAEMKAYGDGLLHPQGGPELVIHALLTGPEYACR